MFYAATGAALLLASFVLLFRNRNDGVGTCRNGEGSANLHDEDFFRGRILRSDGRAFVKAWNLKNTGRCTWTPSFAFTRELQSGSPLSSTKSLHPLTQPVPPGGFARIAVPMHAPTVAGTALERWTLRDATGDPIAVDGYPELVAEFRGIQLPARVCADGEERARIAQQSLSEGQLIAAGRTVIASWSVYNDGLCAWPKGSELVRDDQLAPEHPGVMSGQTRSTRRAHDLQPGVVATFTVPMHVPETPGLYSEHWTLRSASGRSIPISPTPTLSIAIEAVASRDLESRSQAPACLRAEMRAGFVSELPYDDEVFAPGQPFEKAWAIANKGDCRWDVPVGLKFLSASGPRMSSVDFVPVSASVMPQRTSSFVIPMIAPAGAQADTESWQLVDREGKVVMINNFNRIWVAIRTSPPGKGRGVPKRP